MKSTIMEKSNEAFQTAKLTSYWLYLAGIPEAVEYAKLIGIDATDPSVIPYHEVMCEINPIIHEIRYKAINEHIRSSGCRNVLDIACGYSPRGMLLAREGYHYIGLDLPVVAEQVAPAVRDAGLSGLSYIGADATDYDSLKAAAEGLEGPLCIVIEGLTMYLSETDVAAVLSNAARLMRLHEGSVLITTDPGFGYIFVEVIKATRPPERFMETIGMLFGMYQWASDGGLTTQTEKRTLESEIERYRKYGLSAKAVPLFEKDIPMLTIDGRAEPSRQMLRNSLSLPNIFEAEAVTAAETELTAGQEEREFSLRYEIKDHVLQIFLSGRVDSVTSPQLLACVEDHGHAVSSVLVDLSEVDYVSAAGKRSFNLIRRDFPDKPLNLIGMNEKIGKILDQDDIMGNMKQL